MSETTSNIILEPEQVRTMNCAFLLALAKLDLLGLNEGQRELHKKRLAHAIMDSAKDVEMDVMTLADAAFERLQETYAKS